LLAIHAADAEGTTYTNVDGLETTNIYDIIQDDDGQKWVAGEHWLIRFGGDDPTMYPLSNVNDEPYTAYRIVDYGEYLWIGGSERLDLFSKTRNGGEFPLWFGSFGDLPDDPEVKDILLLEDTIWLATSAGLATAVISDPKSLKFPSSWTTFDQSSFGGGGLQRLVTFGSSLYLAASTGLWRMDITGPDTSFTLMSLGSGEHITDLYVAEDSLLFFFEGGTGLLVDSVLSFLSTPGLPAAPSRSVDFADRRWMAVTGEGVYYEDGGGYVEYPHTGMPGNAVSDLTINRDGVITAAFMTRPAATLIDDVWKSYEFGVGERTTLVISDSAGRPWVGTRGNGLWLLSGDSAINYDEQNSTLIGNTDDPPNGLRFIVVNGLATDGRFLYAASYRAANGEVVAIADLQKVDDPVDGWTSLGANQGLDNTFVTSLDIYQGFVAVGNEFSALYLCEAGSEPFHGSVEQCFHFTRENSWLRSDNVRVVRFAPDGTIWVGTNVGLSRYDAGIDRFVDVDMPGGIDPDVSDLEFDGRGNLWVGTRGGLARYDATTQTFDAYTTANSGLVADYINALTLDQVTGDLYIATNFGISILITPAAELTNEVQEAVAFPNPFVIRSPQDSLAFNFARPAVVRIYTTAGELVWDQDANHGWFGLNQAGRRVAAGVYIFVLEDSEGNIARGKFLLVRE